jgi:fatty acid desaturase
MQPTERPRNDNWNPADGEPPEPGLFSTRKRAIESTLSLIGLAVIWGAAFLWLSGTQWLGLAITLAVAFVGMLIAGIYRLIVHGRA